MSEYAQEDDTVYSPVPSSWITPTTNPKTEGWYEWLDGNEDDEPSGVLNLSGYYRTNDTTPVSGKQYFVEGEIAMSETAIAYSTYQTYLMYRTSSSGSYTKLIDIKDYPDLRQTPNLIDVTTLSHAAEKQIPGIIRMGDGYGFTANYTASNFSTVQGLEGHQYDYAVYFGGTTAGVPDGNQGVIKWTGDVFAAIVGKGVDDAREMTVTCFPSTDPQWAASPST